MTTIEKETVGGYQMTDAAGFERILNIASMFEHNVSEPEFAKRFMRAGGSQTIGYHVAGRFATKGLLDTIGRADTETAAIIGSMLSVYEAEQVAVASRVARLIRKG